MKQVIFLSIVLSFLIFFINNEVCASREKRSAKKTPDLSPDDPSMIPEKYCDLKCTPTVHPATDFDAKADADSLNKAMQGVGTDEKTIIDIVTKRGLAQRLQIAKAYKVQFGHDLVQDLKGEVSGFFQDSIVALMTPLPIFLATEIHDSIAKVGTDEEAMVEILCSLNNHGIKSVSKIYQSMYDTTLEKDVRSDTSGTFQKLMVSLLQGERDENLVVDNTKAAADAQTLYKAGEKSWGTDESEFNKIFVTRSEPQLRQIFVEYKKISGNDIEKAIEKEFSGNVKKGLLALARILKSKPKFFAERLYESMKGAGTRDRDLIRVIVYRNEIDLGTIKAEFQPMYGQTLEQMVTGDTTGDYRDTLLALIKG